MGKIYWTTRAGEKIDVDEMDINHLRHTLKMIIINRERDNEINDDELYVGSDPEWYKD